MAMIDPETYQPLRQAVKAHKRTLRQQEWHEASLEKGKPVEVEPPFELNDEDFTECTADLDSPCDCPKCEESARESMADAFAEYLPNFLTETSDNECECGGTFDEYEACSDCENGHDDHDLNSCFACFERAVGRAEAAAEGER